MIPEERRDGIGGSDAGDLMNAPPWGCQRRLWYQKRGVPADLEDTKLERLFERGHRLEALVIGEYRAATKRQVWTERKGQQKHLHPDVPYFYYHRDAFIPKHLHGGTPGILECKTMGAFPFRQLKRQGLNDCYIFQVQWGCMVLDLAWGAYAVLWPDAWDLIHWDVLRDDEICRQLRATGETFWPKVQNGPAPDQLGHDDPRCKKCLWRYTCWQVPESERHEAPTQTAGEVIEIETDETLAQLVQDYWDMRMIASDHEETLEAIKQELKNKLGEREGVRAAGYKLLYSKAKPTSKFIIEKLRKDFPRILDLCSIPALTSRRLMIYEDKQVI